MPLTSRRLGLAGLLLLMNQVAHAQFAVIDVASVAQLIQQAQTLAAQLEAARGQLAQAQAQYQACLLYTSRCV